MTTPMLLDASVLISAMNPDDEHHGAASSLLRRGAIQGQLLAHPITVAESAVGAAQNGRLRELRVAYSALDLQVTVPDADEPWRLAQHRATTRLPLPDCCVLDAAIQTGASLSTFDARLAAAAQSADVPVVQS
jgi:predicted nucleic acid-binding protein